MRNKAILLALMAGLMVAPLNYAQAFGIGNGLGSVKRQLAPKFIAHRGVTLAPMGHVIFCSKTPQQCRTSGRAIVKLDAKKKRELNIVNAKVNRAIRPVNDKGSNGWADTWTVGPKSGDCEDYALTKRAELISRGWPSRALRIAVAKTRWGEGHAVLVVRTSDGDLVLDNRRRKVVPWSKAGLTWLKIQSAANARTWLAL
ncbi:transglutaminase-like cysteine peptidase [Roseibium polysiphoniae]|uniref:transglutaminase-like cysteine peptidase n=1 Tax=Roseibium polysiphoniae TaxID=2571221 RepID=UPI0032992026